MKRLIILFMLAMIFFTVSNAQVDNDPVKWRFSTVKVDEKTFELHCTAYIQQPWHIYSQKSVRGLGMPTKFIFAKQPLINIDGAVIEKGDLKRQTVDKVELKYYLMRVDFVQTVKLKVVCKTNISGVIEYMACTDMQCLPPVQKHFSVKLQ